MIGGDLQNIARKLADTQATISELKDQMARMETIPPSVESTLIMLNRRHDELDAAYMEAAANRNLEVCRYKLFAPESSGYQPKVKTFANALIGLQNVFSLVYDALVQDRPKQQSKISPEAYGLTSFDFAYSTHNSLGVVLTLPAEAIVPLFGQTTIDEAMETVFKLLAARDSQDIAVYAKQLGLAPIRNLYAWVATQAEAGVSAELQWHDQSSKFSTVVKYEEFENLKAIIEASSAEDVSEIELDGILHGIDIKSSTFHMTVEGIGDIKGRIESGIGKAETIEVPVRYRARIRVSRVISYAFEKETKGYFLLSLERPD